MFGGRRQQFVVGYVAMCAADRGTLRAPAGKRCVEHGRRRVGEPAVSDVDGDPLERYRMSGAAESRRYRTPAQGVTGRDTRARLALEGPDDAVCRRAAMHAVA